MKKALILRLAPHRIGEPNGPGFPWWACVGATGLVAIGGFLARAGYADGRRLGNLEPEVTRKA